MHFQNAHCDKKNIAVISATSRQQLNTQQFQTRSSTIEDNDKVDCCHSGGGSDGGIISLVSFNSTIR